MQQQVSRVYSITEEEALTELIILPTIDLYNMIGELYESIHCKWPTFMCKWDSQDLLDWFTAYYEFNEDKQTWYCIHDSATVH